jgi:hypothetical protein
MGRTIDRVRVVARAYGCLVAKGTACVLAVTLGAGVRPLGAQASGAVRLRADNDGFDFWKRPARRSDGEYTSGLQMRAEMGHAPRWWRLTTKTPPCADAPDTAPRCASAEFAVGQEMYTPAEDSQPYTYAGWQNQRPYAGWLYGSLLLRSVRRSTIRTLGLTLGVTGPPSLADRAQEQAHAVMWRYARQPLGWETQIRFEPGVILSARQAWEVFAIRIGPVRLIDATVNAGASAGNILTNVEAGGDLRAGINLSHPWRRSRRRGPAEIVASIGVRGQAIARSIFLDGNTINPDRRVARIPGVGDVRGSIGLRLGALVLSYAVTQRGREYETGPRSHTFASLIAGIGGTADAAP